MTPLMLGAREGKLNIVSALTARGADQFLRCHASSGDTNGFTALMFASQEGHEDVVEYLVDAFVEQFTKKAGPAHSKPRLLEETSIKGKTALLLAAEKGHRRIARTLIHRGASVNSIATDALGLQTCPLFEVSRSENAVRYPNTVKRMHLMKYMIRKDTCLDKLNVANHYVHVFMIR